MSIVDKIIHGDDLEAHNRVITASGSSDQGRGAFVLHIHNLSYKPSPRMEFFEIIRRQVYNLNIGWLFPAIKHANKDKVSETVIYRAHFSAVSGEVTGIIGERSERFELISLITGIKKHGYYDGDILLSGPSITSKDYYYDKVAFVQKEPLYIPGLTYYEMLKYAAELKVKPKPGVQTALLISERIEDLMNVMNLHKCKDRKLTEYPNLRGEEGGDLRRLSIAMEIIDLPPVLVIDEPTLSFDPAISVSIMHCLQALARRGHIVLCSFSKPYVQEFEMLDRVVMFSEGFSVYANSAKNVKSYFCGREMGYELKKDVDIVEFTLDILAGVERPITQRAADLPNVMQDKFEASDFNTHVHPGPDAITAFSDEYFFLYGYGRFDAPLYALYRLLTVIKRSVLTKIKDDTALKQCFGASILIGVLVGYLQLRQGSYGNFTLMLLGIPYANTANLAAFMFFITCFSFSLPILQVHIICKKLQLFRYEQQSGCCTTFAFSVATILSEVPFTFVQVLILSSITFFMTVVGKGEQEYNYFVFLLILVGLLGVASMYLLASIFKEEMIVRDVFLFIITFCALLSGFPFQFSSMTGYLASASVVNPLRWCFEGLMEWKFAGYEDGIKWLTPFEFNTFTHQNSEVIIGNFIIITLFLNVLFLLKEPLTLRKDGKEVKRTGMSLSFSKDGRGSTASIDDLKNPLEPALLERRSTRQSELFKPVLFMRESSVTGNNSKLSVNVSQVGEENLDRGPNVQFKNITFVTKDAKAPGGVKYILNRVSGQFNWGNLSAIMGSSSSGKTSLLHVLSGDMPVGADITGRVMFNGRVPQENLPLWQRCGFVAFQNEHIRDLTVRQVLTFAMKLRCHNRLGLSVVEENVKKTLENMHLDDIAMRKTKTLNPGELKRLSIAEEMVHGPKLLLMDEPTTGVGPYETSIMMLTFREMVNQDRTVIATVHQPNPEMLKLFDTLLLMSQGRVIYHGPTANATSFFVTSPFGYDISQYTNPADFLADISGAFISDKKGEFNDSSILENYYMQSEGYQRLQSRLKGDSAEAKKASTENPLALNYGRKISGSSLPKDRDSEFSGNGVPGDNRKASVEIDDYSVPSRLISKTAFGYNLPVNLLIIVSTFEEMLATPSFESLMSWFFKGGILIERTTYALGQRYELVVSSIIIHSVLACIFGWIMGNASGSSGIYNTTSLFAIGSLFLILANVAFIFYLFNNHQVFLKEHSRGLYSNWLKWITSDYPLYVLRAFNALIFVLIVFGMTDQPDGPEKFGFAILAYIFFVLTSCMLTECVIYANNDKRSCYIGLTGLAFTNFVFSGLFIKAQSLPRWMAPWVPSLSIIRWNMQSNFINVYLGNDAAFPVLPSGYSIYTSFLNLFGWGGKTKWYCFGMLIINFFVYKIISLFLSGISAANRKGGRRYVE